MAGPSDTVSPSELFLKLLEPQPSEVVDFPRRDARGNPVGQIRIQVLAQEDHDQARIDAHRKMKAGGLDKDDLASNTIQEVIGDAVARELLARSCLTVSGADFEDGKEPRYAHVFQSAEQLKKLRPDEIAVLFSAYMLTQAKFGPYEKFVGSADDVNKWVKRLEEGGSEFPLLRLQLPHLVELAFALAQRTYLLSVILESQWSSLPDTFKSRLADCSLDIGYFGGPAATSTETGGASLVEAPVTTEQAARLAESLKDE
jgi:hypothetical protein